MRRGLMTVFVLGLATACTSSQEDPAGTEPGEVVQDKEAADEEEEFEGDGEGVSFRRTFTYSLSNDKMSPYTYDRAAVQRLVQEGAGDRSRKAYQQRVFLGQLGRRPLSIQMKEVGALNQIVLKRGIKNKLAGATRLELLYSAMEQKNFGLFEILAQELAGDSNPKIQAAVATARGILADREGDAATAAAYWKEALGKVASYEPALLNLGLISLRYGNFAAAAKILAKVPDNWFARSYRAAAARHVGDDSFTGSQCPDLVEEHPQHKTVLFNCGLYFWQQGDDVAQARDLMSKALKLPGGERQWNERGYKLFQELARAKTVSADKGAAAEEDDSF